MGYNQDISTLKVVFRVSKDDTFSLIEKLRSVGLSFDFNVLPPDRVSKSFVHFAEWRFFTLFNDSNEWVSIVELRKRYVKLVGVDIHRRTFERKMDALFLEGKILGKKVVKSTGGFVKMIKKV